VSAPPGWKDAYAEEEVEVVPCPLCGSGQADEVAEEFTLRLSRCRSCGMEYVRRRIRFSEQNYRPDPEHLLHKYEPVLGGRVQHNREPLYGELLRRLQPHRGEGRLLDVGPFMGFFLRRAAREGWHVAAVDQSPTIAQIVRERIGVEDVRLGYLEQLGIDSEFDVVTFLDVLEHVRNPVEVLAAARRAVRPGGVVLVKVPHARWNHVKRRLGFRDAYDAREHILQFRAETLEEAFCRAGLEPVKLFLPGPVQGGTWRRRVPRRAVWLLGAALFRLQGRPGPLSLDLALIGRRPAEPRS
jgi:2-polyprenyl-3-methyl-5-hydroxy-6-metoxy-1,4-benzoquinol methylase